MYRQAEELGYVSETDSGGVVWRDWIDDILAGGGAEDPSGYDPATGLPYGVHKDANSPSGYIYQGQAVKADGSLYMGGAKGGSTNPTNVYIGANPGGLMVQKTVPAGGDDSGLPAGTVYQENQVTGAITKLYTPSTSGGATNFNDTNGDGYDDQTGLPNGVATIGGKLYYHGVRVKPDGSPYTGAADAGENTQVVGSAGGGYYERQSDGSWKLVIPGSSSGGSSGGGGGISSGGGGSNDSRSGGFNNTTTTTNTSTSQNTSDIGPNTAASQQAQRAQDQAQFDLQFAYKQQQDALNRGDTLAARAEQQRIDQAKLKLEQIAAYRSAVTDTDPLAQQAWAYGGLSNPVDAAHGGNWMNAIKQGGDALSPEVLSGAAGILGEMRGNPSGGLSGGQVTGGGVATNDTAGGGATPPGGNIGISPATGRVTAPPSAPAPPAAAPPASSPFATITVGGMGQDHVQGAGQQIQVVAGADGQPLKDANGNYYLYDSADKLGQGMARTGQVHWNAAKGGGFYDAGTSTAAQVNASGQPVDATGNVIQSDEYWNQIATQARTSMSHGGLLANTYGRGATAAYNFSGLGGQSVDPSKGGYKTPAQQWAATKPTGMTGTIPGGGLYDPAKVPAPVATAPTGGLSGGQPVQPVLPNDQKQGTTATGIDPHTGLPYKTVIPMLADGGLADRPYISGEAGPELNIPQPGTTTMVQPLGDAPGLTTTAPISFTPPPPPGETFTPPGTTAPWINPDAGYAPVKPPSSPSPYPSMPQPQPILPGDPNYPVRPTHGMPFDPRMDPGRPYTMDEMNPGIVGTRPGQPRTRAPGSPLAGADQGSSGGLSGGSLTDEVGAMRRGALGPNANYMDVAFEKIPYTVRKAYFEWLRDKYGISVENSTEEAARYRMGGLSRGQLVGSQGR
jgi:hypothetical protein